MKGLTVIAVLVTVSLAGCFGSADPPADAVTDTNEALPGLTLSAWTEEIGGRLRMMAVVNNDGDQAYDTRTGCGEPWRSHIIGPMGEEVEFVEVLEEPACPVYWDVLRPRGELDVLYSWNYRDHDVDAGTSEPVANGIYTWVLQFTLRDSDEVLETQIPIRVGSDDDGPLADFQMVLRPGRAGNLYGVNVTVLNGGPNDPEFWTGCYTEWAVRVLDADGDEVPRRQGGTCAGFLVTTFPNGTAHHAEFFWNGTTYAGDVDHIVPAGEYQWEVTFGLQGRGGDVITKRASFTV